MRTQKKGKNGNNVGNEISDHSHGRAATGMVANNNNNNNNAMDANLYEKRVHLNYVYIYN